MTNTIPHESISSASPQTVEWRGDGIVENPDFTSDLVTEFPISVDDLWAGPRGITRIGPASEGYAGYLLPRSLQRVVKGTNLEFMLPPTSEQQSSTIPRQLEVGSGIPDGNGSEELVVVDLDNDTRRITFEAKWYQDRKDRQELHYSWEIHALEGTKPGTSLLFTRTRIQGLEHPELWKKGGPIADKLTMSLVRRGILEKKTTSLNTNKNLGGVVIAATIAGLGIAAARKRRS